MASKKLKLIFTGLSPLLMHNGQLADPLNEFTKKMKEVSGKKKKTEADFEQLAKFEFLGSLWLNDKGKPIIPSHVIEAVGVAGAKKIRDGQTAKAAFFAEDALLTYTGPKEAGQLVGVGDWRPKYGRFKVA